MNNYYWSLIAASGKKCRPVWVEYITATSNDFNLPAYSTKQENINNTDHLASIQLYDENRKLVSNLRPCLSTEDKHILEPALYDVEHKKYYYNQGTSVIKYGNVIHEVEYIESTGTQYINLPKFPNELDIDIAIDVEHTNGYNEQILFGNIQPDNIQYIYCTNAWYTWKPADKYVLSNQLFKRVIFDIKTTTQGVEYYANGVRNTSIPTNFYNSYRFANTYHCLCARTKTSGNDYYWQGKIYSFNLTSNNIYYISLIPAQRDDKIGLFDIISGEFFTSAGTEEFIAGPIVDHEAIIEKCSYGLGWVDDASYPDWVGNKVLLAEMPCQKSLKGCLVDYKTEETVVAEGGYSLTYAGKRDLDHVQYLNPEDWTLACGNTSLDEGDNINEDYLLGTPMVSGNTGSDIFVHNDIIWYKSYKHAAGVKDHTLSDSSTYNEMRISPIQVDPTWHYLKEGYTGSAKASIVSNIARCNGNACSSENRGSKEGVTHADLVTWCQTKAPTVSVSRRNMNAAAMRSGCHMLSFEEYQILFYWLPAIEYKTFQIESSDTTNNGNTLNLQTNEWVKRDDASTWLGTYGMNATNAKRSAYPMAYHANWANVVNSSTYNYLPSGLTNKIGNYTGWARMLVPTSSSASTSLTTSSVVPHSRYRGLEIFRTMWTNAGFAWFVAGSNSGNKGYVTRNRAIWNDSMPIDSWSGGKVVNEDIRYIGLQCPANGVCAREWTLNEFGEIVAQSGTGTNYNMYKWDGTYTSHSTTQIVRCSVFGGRSSIGSYGGPGCLDSSGGASGANADVGFRIRFNADEYTSIYN